MVLTDILLSEIKNSNNHFNININDIGFIYKLFKLSDNVCFATDNWENLQYVRRCYNDNKCIFEDSLYKIIGDLIKNNKIDLLITFNYYSTTFLYEECKKNNIRYICITNQDGTFSKNDDVISHNLKNRNNKLQYIRVMKLKKLSNG